MNNMKYGIHMLFTLLVVVIQSVLTTGLVFADDASMSASGAGIVTSGSKLVAFYRPPRRGAPATRIGGGSRGPDTGTPSLFVLTPEHTGLTRQSQPTLYWYTSKPVMARIEFSLINDDDLQTVAETELSRAKKAGIHKISLKKLGIKLEQDTPYQWSVAIVMDQENRSSDIFASGTIELVSEAVLSPAVQAGDSGTDAVTRYAAAGLWYDALDTAARLIDDYPGERGYVEQRAYLLEQVGLVEVASMERGFLQK